MSASRKIVHPGPGAIRIYNLVRRVRPIRLGQVIKRLLGVRRFHFRLANGLVFWIDPVSNLGLFLLNTGEYEVPVSEVLREILRPGDVFVDIGANEGFFSVLASSIVGESGAAHAFEPQARLQPTLAENAAANGFGAIMHIHRVALSDERSEMQMHLTADVNTGASSFTRHWRVGAGTETVPTVPLDEFVKEQSIGHIRLAKIDCEGAEGLVVKGAATILTPAHCEHLVIEYHPHIIGREACGRIHNELTRRGYKCLQSEPFSVYTAG